MARPQDPRAPILSAIALAESFLATGRELPGATRSQRIGRRLVDLHTMGVRWGAERVTGPLALRDRREPSGEQERNYARVTQAFAIGLLACLHPKPAPSDVSTALRLCQELQDVLEKIVPAPGATPRTTAPTSIPY